jgi:hypothetical protein
MIVKMALAHIHTHTFIFFIFNYCQLLLRTRSQSVGRGTPRHLAPAELSRADQQPNGQYYVNIYALA